MVCGTFILKSRKGKTNGGPIASLSQPSLNVLINYANDFFFSEIFIPSLSVGPGALCEVP